MEKITIDMRHIADDRLIPEELRHNLNVYTVISTLMAQEIAAMRNLDTNTEVTDQMVIDEYWQRVSQNYEILS